MSGALESIPPSIFVRYYRTLAAIAGDYATPEDINRESVCYWGATGAGKSRQARAEAGTAPYSKVNSK